MGEAYRETLVRECGGTTTLCVGMQNPSKAAAFDATKNDPTVLRLIGFTTRLSFGRLVVVNTSPHVATDPRDHYRWLDSLNMWQRREHYERALEIAIREARKADRFVAAWGNCRAGDLWPKQFADGLVAAGIDLYAFGFTESGAPKHPLARGIHRIPDDTIPTIWRKSAILSSRIGGEHG